MAGPIKSLAGRLALGAVVIAGIGVGFARSTMARHSLQLLTVTTIGDAPLLVTRDHSVVGGGERGSRSRSFYTIRGFNLQTGAEVGKVKVTPNVRALGAKGATVWLGQTEPFLADLSQSRWLITPKPLLKKHAPLGGKVSLDRRTVADYTEGFNPTRGDLLVRASNGLLFSLGMDDTLTPIDPSKLPRIAQKKRCKNNKILAAPDTCLTLTPSPKGCHTLHDDAGHASAPMCAPRLLDVINAPSGWHQDRLLVTYYERDPGDPDAQLTIAALRRDLSVEWEIPVNNLVPPRSHARSPKLWRLGERIIIANTRRHVWYGDQIDAAILDAGGKILRKLSI